MLQSEEETEGPPPFEDIAFWAPNSPGETGYVTWDLPAGEYTVICFLPDLAGDFSAHAAHGMVAVSYTHLSLAVAFEVGGAEKKQMEWHVSSPF